MRRDKEVLKQRQRQDAELVIGSFGHNKDERAMGWL